QALRRVAREAPPVAPVAPVLAADLTDAGNRGQDRAAGLERRARAVHGGAHVVDERQRLREDDAVVGALWDAFAGGQVTDERRLRVAGGRVQEVGLLDAGPEPVRVGALLHFQHAAAAQLLVLLEEALDVETIDRTPAIQSELSRHGFLHTEADAPSLAGRAAEE